MECLRGHTTRALTVLPSPTKSTAIVGVVLCAVAHSGDRAVTGSVSVLIHGHSANAVPAYKSWPLCYFIAFHLIPHTYEACEQGNKHIAVISCSTEVKASRNIANYPTNFTTSAKVIAHVQGY